MSSESSRRRLASAVVKSIVMGFLCAFAVFRSALADEVPCKPSNADSARVLSFDPGDANTINGLDISFQLGLSPETFPAKDIEAQKQPCKRLDFDAKGLTYSLRGEDGATPPRWATTPTHPGETAYIAWLPSPTAALDWYAKYQTDKNTPAQFNTHGAMMVVLSITSGENREVFRFYDSVPDDRTLSQDMCAALAGELPIIAIYHADSGQSELSHLGDKAPTANSACHAKLQ
jgi:hypothetical protein